MCVVETVSKVLKKLFASGDLHQCYTSEDHEHATQCEAVDVTRTWGAIYLQREFDCTSSWKNIEQRYPNAPNIDLPSSVPYILGEHNRTATVTQYQYDQAVE